MFETKLISVQAHFVHSYADIFFCLVIRKSCFFKPIKPIYGKSLNFCFPVDCRCYCLNFFKYKAFFFLVGWLFNL